MWYDVGADPNMIADVHFDESGVNKKVSVVPFPRLDGITSTLLLVLCTILTIWQEAAWYAINWKLLPMKENFSSWLS